MGDLNYAVLLGRLTRDPELRYTQSGKAVAQFTLACNRTYGEDNKADFIGCVAWEKSAELVSNSCKKGQRLLVEGNIRQESWKDDAGNYREKTKIQIYRIHFIEKRGETGLVEERKTEDDKFLQELDKRIDKSGEEKQDFPAEEVDENGDIPLLSQLDDNNIPF